MSDPLRTAPASDGSADADRDALIERLLLAGLDHYFDGQYEQAVNVWTRVAFLERGHGRARAYIERARGALAERQRQSDELVHQGVDAYRRGEMAAARELLTRAAADGGSETALMFLQRLGVAEAGLAAAAPLPRALGDGPSLVGRLTPRRRQTDLPDGSTNWMATILVSAAVATGILLAAQPIASWLGDRPVADPAAGPPDAEPMPIVRTADIRLARAQDLYERGQLHDALRQLDAIDRSDPLRGNADTLTATIQAALLAAASTSPGEAAR